MGTHTFILFVRHDWWLTRIRQQGQHPAILLMKNQSSTLKSCECRTKVALNANPAQTKRPKTKKQHAQRNQRSQPCDGASTSIRRQRRRGAPPLIGVRVVVNSQRPEEKPSAREQVGALPHAVATTNAFLDVGQAPFWTIPRACERNHLSFLPRLATRGSVETNAHYRAYFFSEGLVHAVRNGNIEMVQWLCSEYCARGYVWKAVKKAAAVGNVAILEWLTTRGEFVIHSHTKSIDLAAKNEHLETLDWIYKHLPTARYSTDAIYFAIEDGDMQVVKWLRDHSLEGNDRGCLQRAIRSGNVAMAQFFFDLGYRLDYVDLLGAAAQSRRLDMVQWVDAHYPGSVTACGLSNAMGMAAFDGCFNIVQWLHANRTGDRSIENAMDNAATQGHLDILQWLYENRIEGCTTGAVDKVASNGHLEIVKWLHENRTKGCTMQAMDGAASNSHLDVLMWLHANRREGCTRIAVRTAATYGYLDVLVWLHENELGGFGTEAMDGAARYNHLDVVQWLHKNRSEGCTTQAMDGAAENNHLDMVKWLHENRREGCTTAAVDSASSLEMVQWLHENRSEGCTSKVMDNAVRKGDFELVLYLHSHGIHGDAKNAAMITANNHHFEIFQWFCEMYPSQVDVQNNAYSYRVDDEMRALLNRMEMAKSV